MALWGASAPDPCHAINAARGALLALRKVRAFNVDPRMRGKPALDLKIGLCSGPTVVGNVGAAKRFSYTAIGETINIAARLEKVCADYECGVIVYAHACALLKENFLLCELDRVSIKGAHEPLAMFELIGERKGASAAACAYVAADARALRAYRTAPLPRPQRYGGRYNIRPPIAPRQPRVMAEKAETLMLEKRSRRPI
jgi:adenylate cyclase